MRFGQSDMGSLQTLFVCAVGAGKRRNPVQPSANRNNEQNLWVSHWVRFTRVNLQRAYQGIGLKCLP